MKTSSTLSHSFPTLRYVVAPMLWVVRTRRRRWTAALVLLAIAAAPVVWWSMQLMGLPDIGEPFDVEAFQSFRIPDERNAFVLYIEAAALLKPEKLDGYSHDWLVPWSKADPFVRRSLEEDRAALALFREASERPDSWPVPDRRSWIIDSAFLRFYRMALLEASRLEEQGDMAGAWVWYRAALRSSHHLSRCGGFGRRQIGLYWHSELGRRLATWAADPRTTPAMLRRALDDAMACESIVPSDSDSLKWDYLLSLRRELDEGPQDFARWVSTRKSRALFGTTDGYLSPDQMQVLYDLWRTWHREPERRSRVIRLAVANWLASLDLPPGRRPVPDPNVTGPYDFFAFGPEALAGARALSPEALDRWLASSPEARQKLDGWTARGFRMSGDWIGKLGAKERASRRALLVLLASRLYRCDHGTDSPSEGALVGPYLKELPDDGIGGAVPAQSLEPTSTTNPPGARK